MNGGVDRLDQDIKGKVMRLVAFTHRDRDSREPPYTIAVTVSDVGPIA